MIIYINADVGEFVITVDDSRLNNLPLKEKYNQNIFVSR